MKIIFFLLIAHLILAAASDCQEFKITTFGIIDYDEKKERFVPAKNGYIKVRVIHSFSEEAPTKQTRYGITLQHYNEAFKLTKEHKLFGGERKFGVLSYEILNVNDRIFLVYQEVSPDAQLGKFYVSEIDPSTLETGHSRMIIDPPKERYTETLLKNTLRVTSLFQPYFKLTLQPDKKHILMEIPGESSRKTQIITLAMLSLSWQPVWTEIIDTKVPYDLYTPVSTLVHDKDVYLTYIENKEPHILHMAAATKQVKSLPIKSNKEFFRPDLFYDAEKKKISIASYPRKANSDAGILLAEVNTDKFAVSELKPVPVPEKYIQQIEKENPVRRKVDGTFGMVFPVTGDAGLSHVILDPMNIKPGKNMRSQSKSMIVMQVQKDPVLYTRIGSGIQLLLNYNSHYAFLHKGKLVLLYNDSNKNIALDADKTAEGIDWGKDAVMMAAIVHPDGQLTREMIINYGKSKYVMTPHETVRVNDNTFLLVKHDAKTLFGDKVEVALLTIE
jgi:hypothetical protein